MTVSTHPWRAFLTARLAVIRWLVADGHPDEDILRLLSLDADGLTHIKLTAAVRELDERAEAIMRRGLAKGKGKKEATG